MIDIKYSYFTNMSTKWSDSDNEKLKKYIEDKLKILNIAINLKRTWWNFSKIIKIKGELYGTYKSETNKFVKLKTK